MIDRAELARLDPATVVDVTAGDLLDLLDEIDAAKTRAQSKTLPHRRPVQTQGRVAGCPWVICSCAIGAQPQCPPIKVVRA